MKMRIHAYDNGRDGTTFDVSIGDAGFGVVVEVSKDQYKAFDHVIDVYEDCQSTLAKMYLEAMGVSH